MTQEEKTITRYVATITVGDSYHKEGEEHILYDDWEAEKVQKDGLRLETVETHNRTVYHIYPCTLKKCIYRLELVSEEEISGSDRKNNITIGYDVVDYDEKDWTDRWP